jgi:NADP-dependent aldehyde dehydrogenase
MIMIQSRDARSGRALSNVADETTTEKVEVACQEAQVAFAELEKVGRRGRAEMLIAMASSLEAHGEEVVAIADRESALGVARLTGELKRTCFQLRFFADVLTDGAYLEVAIDHAGPTEMGNRPDLRRTLRPLGPVAVFGASNFPLAFSVPGGDTASALAAGCSVIVKVHDAHPATSVLCATLLAAGARRAGLTSEVVGLVFGEKAGVTVVSHPLVRAVGFTGSLAGGRYLYDVANRRATPIPFYGELGALNTVVVGRAAAEDKSAAIATGLIGSFTLGVGQFCTKPGLVFVPDGEAGDSLVRLLAEAVTTSTGGPMLTERIASAFEEGTARLRQLDDVRVLAEGGPDASGAAFCGVPLLLEATGVDLDDAVKAECFGPVLVVRRYRSGAELADLAKDLSPGLTATVHAEEADEGDLGAVVAVLNSRVGRLIWNGYPTGVAVAWAMHHGGPYPATTDPLHTSVGAAAIRRWLKPIAYQDMPQHLLPPELRDITDADHSVPRRVDGSLASPPGYTSA